MVEPILAYWSTPTASVTDTCVPNRWWETWMMFHSFKANKVSWCSTSKTEMRTSWRHLVKMSAQLLADPPLRQNVDAKATAGEPAAGWRFPCTTSGNLRLQMTNCTRKRQVHHCLLQPEHRPKRRQQVRRRFFNMPISCFSSYQQIINIRWWNKPKQIASVRRDDIIKRWPASLSSFDN